MASRLRLAIGLLSSAALAGTVAYAQPATEGRTFTITLTGAAECNNAGVCGVGDLDGEGTVTIRIIPSDQQICYQFNDIALIDTPVIGAHFHIGEAGVAGPVVVPLEEPSLGDNAEFCITSGRWTAQLWARPQEYYVNVHTTPFPGGAIRGQLPERD